MNIFYNDRLRVLAYHKVNDIANFKTQLEYLKSKYTIIGLSDLKNHLYNNVELPNNSVLITFDDGDRSVYKSGFPLLRQLKVPAILFVITELVDTKKPFWWDEIEYYLDDETGNKKVWEVKKWKNKSREEYIKKLRKNSLKLPFKENQLTTNELIEMSENDIAIANHSHSHPMFDKCTVEELNREINNSNSFLRNLNLDYNIFAYPNGNFSEWDEDLLNVKGIKLAFLFDHKINDKKIKPLRISRLMMSDSTPFWKFKLILSGFHSKILPFRKYINKLGTKLT